MSRARNPRDHRDWRIPSKNTISWHIYKLMSYGVGPTKITRVIGNTTRNNVSVLMYGIRHPDVRMQKLTGKSQDRDRHAAISKLKSNTHQVLQTTTSPPGHTEGTQ